MNKYVKKVAKPLLFLLVLMFLTGCEYALFDPQGTRTISIRDTMFITAGLMLLVVIPTVILSVWVPFSFRSSKKDNKYTPDWEHSSAIEALVWGIPILIIAVLAAITYFTSYSLDPRKEIESDKATNIEPLTIQVVALDWKWLFIYPEEKIATVNEIYVPVNQPVEFLITSNSTMNSFFIPRLSGQLYAMAGMENRLNMMAEKEGVYRGISANYSGYGFSGMRFKTHVTSNDAFKQWVAKVKTSKQVLSDAEFEKLTEKTRDHGIEHFSRVRPLLFKDIIEKYTGVQ